MRGFKIFLTLGGFARLAPAVARPAKSSSQTRVNRFCAIHERHSGFGLAGLALRRCRRRVADHAGCHSAGIFPGATYQARPPGDRHLKIFQSSLDPTFADPTKTTPAIVSTVFVDSTFTLETGKHYTIVAVGSFAQRRRSSSSSRTTTPIPVRASPCERQSWQPTPLDVYRSPSGGTAALPTTPLAASLAPFTASTWKTSAPGAFTLRANAAGSTTLPAMVDAAAPAGVAADKVLNLSAIGGARSPAPRSPHSCSRRR